MWSFRMLEQEAIVRDTLEHKLKKMFSMVWVETKLQLYA